MGSLLDILVKVCELKNDLSATTILASKSGHYEEVPHGRYCPTQDSQGNCYCITEREFVPDKVKRIPNKEKIKSAQKELEKIYQSSKWYSARYRAGEALGKNMKKIMPLWLSEIEKSYKNFNDPVNQVKCVKDLGFLDKSNIKLKRIYNKNTNKEVRIQAGKELGYSNIRIKFHEIFRFK